jgi:cytochrome P450
VGTAPDLPNTARCPVVRQFPFDRDDPEVTVSRPEIITHAFPFARKTPVDISPELDRLRTHEPVCRVRMATGDEAWLVTGYDDVRFVLDDPRFSMEEASDDNAAELMPMVKLFPGLFSLDGAEHARSRQLLARGFRTRDTQSFRSWVTQTTDELALDLLADDPPADLIVGFCEPLVTRVACRLLGLTSEQLTEFRTHFRVIINVGGLTPAQFGAHWDALRSLVLGIFDARRADPGDDMISDLIVGNVGERAIPEANLVGLLFSLIASLGHSPITQISYGLVTLLRHPAQWDLLIGRPELVHTATAEILRYGVAFEVEHVRVAREDVEVGGVRIARGDAVLTSIAAANRDETKFSDPTRFDISRADNDHLAFGHGAHVCAGSDLGNFMILSSLRSLCPLAPTLRLAVPEDDLFLLSENSHSYSLGSVPVRW